MNTDMTKYRFQHFENAYNIGWKNNCKNIEKRIFDNKFIEKLKMFCEKPLNKELNGKCRYFDIKGEKYVIGFGEIRIIDIYNDIRYAAPNIIVQDILDGLYTPPQQFIDAVMNCPEYASDEYNQFLKNYTEDKYWGENKNTIQNIEKVCSLIEEDSDCFKTFVLDNKLIDVVTKKGSLLNYSIQLGNNNIAEWLIDQNININSFDGLELLTAIKNKNTKIALQLLMKGISTDNDEMKDNPLVFAIRMANVELVKELMMQHRHLIVEYTNEFVKNYTMLDIAKRYKNEQIIEIVKKYL